MKVKVDQEVCIGCGYCASVCPDVFRVEENIEKAVAFGTVTDENRPSVEDAMEGCPVRAISEE